VESNANKPMQRKLNSATRNTKNADTSLNKNTTEGVDKNISVLCWHAVSRLLDQEYESLQSILINFGIVGALLLSILLGLIMTIPVDEIVKADIAILALSSPYFRCYFALLNPTTTLEI